MTNMVGLSGVRRRRRLRYVLRIVNRLWHELVSGIQVMSSIDNESPIMVAGSSYTWLDRPMTASRNTLNEKHRWIVSSQQVPTLPSCAGNSVIYIFAKNASRKRVSFRRLTKGERILVRARAYRDGPATARTRPWSNPGTWLNRHRHLCPLPRYYSACGTRLARLDRHSLRLMVRKRAKTLGSRRKSGRSAQIIICEDGLQRIYTYWPFYQNVLYELHYPSVARFTYYSVPWRNDKKMASPRKGMHSPWCDESAGKLALDQNSRARQLEANI